MGKAASGGGIHDFIRFVVLPLLLLDGYALWRLAQATEQWQLRLLPGNVAGTLGTLTILLGANTAVIGLLALAVRRR